MNIKEQINLAKLSGGTEKVRSKVSRTSMHDAASSIIIEHLLELRKWLQKWTAGKPNLPEEDVCAALENDLEELLGGNTRFFTQSSLELWSITGVKLYSFLTKHICSRPFKFALILSQRTDWETWHLVLITLSDTKGVSSGNTSRGSCKWCPIWYMILSCTQSWMGGLSLDGWLYFYGTQRLRTPRCIWFILRTWISCQHKHYWLDVITGRPIMHYWWLSNNLSTVHSQHPNLKGKVPFPPSSAYVHSMVWPPNPFLHWVLWVLQPHVLVVGSLQQSPGSKPQYMPDVCSTRWHETYCHQRFLAWFKCPMLGPSRAICSDLHGWPPTTSETHGDSQHFPKAPRHNPFTNLRCEWEERGCSSSRMAHNSGSQTLPVQFTSSSGTQVILLHQFCHDHGWQQSPSSWFCHFTTPNHVQTVDWKNC